ncbi:MAG: NVEALA domain-containing protein [Dysgonamonadaceae bacterium]|jgi:hypothetical protein|nr:NVEALA domain-containing protein [Dysgonamonadaceae bacterium]
MNKKILRGCAVLVIAVVAAYNLYLSNSNESAMSDVSLANVEALADDESSGGCKLNLLRICETQHSDHYFYRNM